MQERSEWVGGPRRPVVMFRIDVVAADDAHHRCPDLGGGEFTAEWQVAERLDLGDGPEGKAVRGVDLQDGLHHDHLGSVPHPRPYRLPIAPSVHAPTSLEEGWCCAGSTTCTVVPDPGPLNPFNTLLAALPSNQDRAMIAFLYVFMYTLAFVARFSGRTRPSAAG